MLVVFVTFTHGPVLRTCFAVTLRIMGHLGRVEARGASGKRSGFASVTDIVSEGVLAVVADKGGEAVDDSLS